MKKSYLLLTVSALMVLASCGGTSAESSSKAPTPASDESSVPSTISVTGVTLDQSALEMHPEDTVQLHATVAPANASDTSVRWSTSAEAVATVSARGTVTAVAPGEADITVTTTDGGFTAVCHVTVNAAIDYGTEEDPLTVDEAIAIIGEYDADEWSPQELYISGKVAKGSTFNSKYTSWSGYFEGHEDGSAKPFQIYSVGMASSIVKDDFKKAGGLDGAEIVIHGYCTNYGGTKLEIAFSKDLGTPEIIAITPSEEEPDPEVTEPTFLTEPAAGTYYAGVKQVGLNKMLYLTGAKNGNFLATTEEDAAKVLTVEAHGTDGWDLKLGDKYVALGVYNDKVSNQPVLQDEAPETAWKWNSVASTFVFDLTLSASTTQGYLGTYGSYATISGSDVSYLIKDGAVKEGQCPLHIYNAIA